MSHFRVPPLLGEDSDPAPAEPTHYIYLSFISFTAWRLLPAGHGSSWLYVHSLDLEEAVFGFGHEWHPSSGPVSYSSPKPWPGAHAGLNPTPVSSVCLGLLPQKSPTRHTVYKSQPVRMHTARCWTQPLQNLPGTTWKCHRASSKESW